MANSYKPGKFAGTLQANVVGDTSKTTPTLGDDFDVELANLKSAQKKIENNLSKIKTQVSALMNDKETGKMATSYLKSTIRRMDKLKDSLATSVNKVSKAINSAQKAEWKRYKAVLDQWIATQNQGNATSSGTTAGTSTNTNTNTSTSTSTSNTTSNTSSETTSTASTATSTIGGNSFESSGSATVSTAASESIGGTASGTLSDSISGSVGTISDNID